MKKKKTALHAKYFLFLIPLLCGLLLYFILPFFPSFTEKFFSGGVFVVLSHAIGFITSLLPFSLTEFSLYALIILLIAAVVFMIMKKLKIKTFLQIIAWGLSCFFLMYMLLHGVNYYRNTAYELMGYDSTQTYSTQQLYSVCKKIALKANEERGKTDEDENGCMKLSEDIWQTLKNAKSGYKNIIPEYGFMSVPSANAKPVLISHLWSYTGIAGVYMPLFCEPNVNIDIPSCRIPANASHELAHTCGFAREDECNFFAYLSCINSEYEDYRYSGYLLAYTYLSNELYGADKALYYEIAAMLADGVINDLKQSSSYWAAFEGGVMDASDAVNDTFIKAQGVEEGSQSYNNVVLLIMHYETAKGC